MSTSVAFARNLPEARKLHHDWERTCKILVNRRTPNDQRDRRSDEPTAPNVKILGPAAIHLHDSCGPGNPISVKDLECTESLPNERNGEKRTKDVVVVDNRFGEVDLSLRHVSARIDRAPRAAQAS
jgi:single-strand DNA-binding protein